MNHLASRRRFLRLLTMASAGAALGPWRASDRASAQSAAPAAPPGPAVARQVEQWYQGARKEGKVVWWDAWDKDIVEKLAAAFMKRYPGVTLEAFLGTDDDTKLRALAEGRAGNVTFDVIVTSSGNYFEYKKAGLVTDNSDVLDAIGVPKELRYEGTYDPTYFVYGAAYNPNLVKESELPRTWEGFLDPKWKGQLAVESRLKLFVFATPFWGGEEKVISYLQRLRTQAPRFVKGDIASNKLLVAGEFPILLPAYLTNYPRYVPQGAPWGYVPLDEVYVTGGGPGYTRPPNAPHPNAGKLFMYWFMGPEGQAIFDERFTGNPMPGANTGPARFLEKHKITPRLVPVKYEQEIASYTRKYADAVGLPIR
ncbi:MAG TPA: extracellular solute-binding protein [Methylomirabilota bacterium]|nr:extracellular solute-binding protein [Methylomirabilota bacterium]